MGQSEPAGQEARIRRHPLTWKGLRKLVYRFRITTPAPGNAPRQLSRTRGNPSAHPPGAVSISTATLEIRRSEVSVARMTTLPFLLPDHGAQGNAGSVKGWLSHE